MGCLGLGLCSRIRLGFLVIRRILSSVVGIGIGIGIILEGGRNLCTECLFMTDWVMGGRDVNLRVRKGGYFTEVVVVVVPHSINIYCLLSTIYK